MSKWDLLTQVKARYKLKKKLEFQAIIMLYY